MDSPTPGARTRSWLAGSMALLLLGLGQSVVAPWAAAEETPDPSPSAEASASPKAEAPKDDAEPKPSAKPTETAQPTESAKPKESATPKESAEPKESAKPSRPATSQPAAPAPSKSAAPSRAPSAAPTRATAVAPNAIAAREGIRSTTPDGAEYWVPAQWTLGQDLVISGAGWRTAARDAGSVIAVKLDGGAVKTKETIRHPITKVEQTNKTIYALVQADAEGEWTLRLPYPTAANSDADWSPGQTHTINLLTGSLLDGDVIRSGPGTTTVTAASEPEPTVAPTPTPTPTPTPPVPTAEPTTPAPNPTPTTPAPTTAPPTPTEPVPPKCVPAPAKVGISPASVGLGGVLRVTGSGFCHPAGDGSVVAIKIDDGAFSRLDSSVHANKTVWAIVPAGADGTFDVQLQLPDGTDAGTNGSSPALKAGAHTLRFLTGSLRTGDQTRSLSAGFTVVGGDPGDPATQPPSWAHDTVSAGGATAWVQRDVATESGSTIKIKGTGWTNRAGTGGSTVALKLNRAGGQYARTGSGIVAPNGAPDATIWKLLAPSNKANHPNVIAIPASGNFEIAIDAPPGLKAGQLLSVQFQSGKFDSKDKSRSVATSPLIIGGVPYVEVPDADVTCKPTSAIPVVTVDKRASLGGTLHVTGAGFCHPAAKRGGSTIAIKIDDGAVSRLNDALHSNRTIWAIVEAKASDGTFDIQLALPDGTTKGAAGSSPAFKQGGHTLRFLTGSLKDGDTPRTVQSAEFVVGSYRPNGPPDPVEATEDLTAATRNGVEASRTSTTLTVTVPGAKAGDWVYLNTYSGGSPTSPWDAAWFRADAGGRVKASLTGVTLPTGTSKLSVQSGNEGEVGKLLGWTSITVAADKANETPSDTTNTIRTIVRTTTTTADDSSAPTAVPKAPVERASQLTGLSNGDATAKADGTKLTVTLPKGGAGQWVYVYLYSGASVAKAGWVQLTDAKAFTVDLKGLADGRHRVVAVNADGGIVGWVDASKGSATTVTTSSMGSPPAPGDPAAAALTQPGSGSMEPVLIGAAVAVLAAGLVGLRRLAKPKGVA